MSFLSYIKLTVPLKNKASQIVFKLILIVTDANIF